jgi:hypothetical protein
VQVRQARPGVSHTSLDPPDWVGSDLSLLFGETGGHSDTMPLALTLLQKRENLLFQHDPSSFLDLPFTATYSTFSNVSF